MASSVFHQGAAKIAVGETPSLAKVSHAVMNIHVRLCKFRKVAFEAQHRRCFGPDLHQSNFSDAADGARIIAALDRCDGVGNVSW